MDIKIVVTGDDLVGKSTLISTLLTERFEPAVQTRLPPLTITPELLQINNVTTGNVEGKGLKFSTTIIDCSSKNHFIHSSIIGMEREELKDVLNEASVVMLCYEDLERVQSFWMPFITQNVQFLFNVHSIIC